jgi:hypothetical protein
MFFYGSLAPTMLTANINIYFKLVLLLHKLWMRFGAFAEVKINIMSFWYVDNVLKEPILSIFYPNDE